MTQAAYEHNGQQVSATQFYAIACDPQRSVAVEACAGAGKTWMLVSRMIRALLEDESLLSHEILAITFTKKAAGEMRERLQEWLEEFAFASPEKLASELKIRGIDVMNSVNKVQKTYENSKNDLKPAYSLPEQLQNLYHKTLSQGRGVQIKTFHGWFASLLRTAPLSVLEGLNLPANYTLLEDDKLATPSVWRRFFGTLLNNASAKLDFEALVAEHGRSQALKALDEALSKRVEFALADAKGLVDASVPHFSEFFPDFAGYESPEAAFLGGDANNLIRRQIFLDAAKILGAASQKTFSAKGVELEKAITDNDLNAAIAALLTEKGTPRKFNETFASNEFVAKAQDLALRFQSAIAQHAAWQHQQRMVKLTRLLINEFGNLKRQRGWVDMNDVERAALVMLSSSELSGWVQERLDARVKHLMIDEFQDTSPLQWQALYAWLSGYAGAGAKPPTVFIVGDPKQSIYRFRRAEPQVFIAAKAFVQEGLDGDLLSCDHTRRNAVQVVQAVNTVMLQAQESKQYSDYRAHSTEMTLQGAVVQLPQIERMVNEKSKDKTAADHAEPTWRDSLTEPKEEIEEKTATLECRQAAQYIQALLQSGKKPKEIMVLARKRARLTLMQIELQTLGIASQQPEKTNLADAPEVQDIVALLDVLVSPTHDLSLAQALKSPLFGVTDHDLVEIALAKKVGSNDHESLPNSWPNSWFDLLQNSELINEEIRRIGAKLTLWKGWIDSLPPHDALDAIFHDAEVLARFASAAPATRRDAVLANLNALLSAALDIDQARYLTPYAFVRAMKAGLSASKAVNADGESDMADATQTVKSPMTSDDSAIRLLTIHGAKGLEADVVLILDAHASPEKAKNMSVLVNWPGKTETPTSFVFQASESRPAPSIQTAFEAEKTERQREELNALYVAMTRAKQQLVISSHEPHHPNADSWWQRMQGVSVLEQPVAHSSFSAKWESTSATMDSRLRGNDEILTNGEFAAETDEPMSVELWVLPNIENTKKIEKIASNMPLAGVLIDDDAIENVVNSKDSLESRIGQAMHRLLQRGDLTVVDAVALEFKLSSIDAEQAVQMAQRVLTGEGAWAWDEAVIAWQGNEIELTSQAKLLRLDRLVRRKDTGTWWVLDYKSESQPQNKPELVMQMRGYIAAVQACYAGEPVKAAFLTAAGKMIELV